MCGRTCTTSRRACTLVDDFTRGRSADDYARDFQLLRAGVERELEIVGEALDKALREHPAQLTDLLPRGTQDHRLPESARSRIRQHGR